MTGPEHPGPARTPVKGKCPACGSASLQVDMWTDEITCYADACPRRLAASEILADVEIEHVVEFTASDFTVQHPLIERLDGALYDCQVHKTIAQFSGPVLGLGRYRVRLVDDRIEVIR